MLDEVVSLEQRLGVPTGFYLNLMSEDDWSFVIKLHALFEAASAYILTKKPGNPKVERTISRLPMSDTQAGKLTLIADLEILKSGQRKFLRFLSELRNRLIHNVDNIAFTFDAYIVAMDKNQTASFVSNAGWGIVEEPEWEGKKTDKRTFVLQNPKLCIWFTASEVLAVLRLEADFVEIEKHKAALEAQKKFQSSRYEELFELLKQVRSGT